MILWYIISLWLLIQQWHYTPDLRSDMSAEVYIGPDHHLSDVSYTPPLLVTIPTTPTLTSAWSLRLRIDALQSLVRMSRDLYDDIWLPLIIISAYRSHNYQQSLINRFGDGNLRAKPWHSEHQLGLAIDVMGLSNAHMEWNNSASKVYQRLVHHGHRYGRHQSYQHGLPTDGYYVEKWHRRYVGKGLATVLKQNNQTLTQYFYQAIRPIDVHGHIHNNPPYIFQSRATSVPAYQDTPSANDTNQEKSEPSDDLFLRPL